MFNSQWSVFSHDFRQLQRFNVALFEWVRDIPSCLMTKLLVFKIFDIFANIAVSMRTTAQDSGSDLHRIKEEKSVQWALGCVGIFSYLLIKCFPSHENFHIWTKIFVLRSTICKPIFHQSNLTPVFYKSLNFKPSLACPGFAQKHC